MASSASTRMSLTMVSSREVMGKAYLEMMDTLQRKVDETEGHPIREVVFSEYIPKNDENIFNQLVNELAVSVK